jgi:hypothetical protein
MPSYYPQIECVLIDVDGNRTAAASLTFNVYNVTTATSLGTTTSNSDGIIASTAVSAVDGDIIRFTHATYPGVYKCVAKTSQEDAFTSQGRRGTTYIVENLQTPITSNRATLIAVDTDNPDSVPIILGTAESGQTVEFGMQKGLVARNYRIYPITETKKGDIAVSDYDLFTTEYADVNIPSGAVAIGTSIGSATAGSVLFAGTSGVLAQDNANLFWDDANNRLGIGTASPAVPLHVSASANSNLGVRVINSGTGGSAAASVIVGESVAGDQIFTIYYANTSNAIYGSNAAVLKAGTAAAGGLLFVHEGNYPADFYTNNTIRMRLQAGGNLTVGTTYNGIGARLVALSTGTQFSAAYDASNYMTATVASNGAVTFDAVGSAPAFIFSDDVSLSTGKRLSLTHDATNSALRLVPASGSPSSLSNGDIWYDNTAGKFKARQAGSTVDVVGTTNSAGNNVIAKSDGTNLVASQITDNGTDVAMASTGGFKFTTGSAIIGDHAGAGNATLVEVNETGQDIKFQANNTVLYDKVAGFKFDVAASQVTLGDVPDAGNRTKLIIDDAAQSYTFKETSPTVTFEPIIIMMGNLPTSNPSNTGQLWNDSGTLKVS